MNHDDEYSFHFLIQWDDGQELQQSLEGQYKRDVPWQEVWSQNPDADNIELESIGRNYPRKKRGGKNKSK
tara:strand:+ start:1128 stop:1337 length:210 start_codon:yes stop_codon:yes gene_type:complete